MRLWTVHPMYLDAKGLCALWREALLARQVLAGRTRGYRHHPQLERFRSHDQPGTAIDAYLAAVAAEARRRAYRFDESKLTGRAVPVRLRETRGQLRHEWRRLLVKIRRRDPARYRALRRIKRPRAHPLFRLVPGAVRAWERSRAGTP